MKTIHRRPECDAASQRTEQQQSVFRYSAPAPFRLAFIPGAYGHGNQADQHPIYQQSNLYSIQVSFSFACLLLQQFHLRLCLTHFCRAGSSLNIKCSMFQRPNYTIPARKFPVILASKLSYILLYMYLYVSKRHPFGIKEPVSAQHLKACETQNHYSPQR